MATSASTPYEPLGQRSEHRAGAGKVMVLLSFVSGLMACGVLFQTSTGGEIPAFLLAGNFRGATTASRTGMYNTIAATSPMARFAMQAIERNNRNPFNERRDVSAKGVAEKAEAREWIEAYMAKQGPGDIPEMSKTVAAMVDDMGMAGVTEPLGFFDPFGFTAELVFNESGKFYQPVSKGKLLFFREVELKHGRVGMLASLGILVGEAFHPLFGGNIDSPAYTAFQETPLQTFWPAVVFAIAIPEMYSVFKFQSPSVASWSIKENHASGDFGFDPLGLKPKDAAGLKEMQNKEINNGRLAMIAAAGMIAQELVTNEKIF